jgi:chemotaxis signal transduction protein
MLGVTVPAPLGLRVLDTVFALPPGAEAVLDRPMFRPLPGAPPSLKGVTMLGRRSALVWALTPDPVVWLSFDHAGGPVIVGGDAIAAPGTDAPPLGIPSLVARPLPVGAISVKSSPDAPTSPPQPATVRNEGTYELVYAGAAAFIPIASLEGVMDMPGLSFAAEPGMPTGALSVLIVEDREALLLDPGWCTGQGGPAGPTSLVAVLHHEGRRFAVPVQQARPGIRGADLAARLSHTPEGHALVAAAPVASALPTARQHETLHPVLLCDAGDTRFALSVAEIATVLAPRQPTPTPHEGLMALRGIVAHRGEVLPVVDLDTRLAAPFAAEALAGAPMLRLALPRPLVVPIRRILGLHMVPMGGIAPTAGDPLIAGRIMLDGMTLPLCRAAALAAPIGTA